MIGIFGILAISLDIALGYTGLFNIAHAALWGVGAYASGLLVLHAGLPFWSGILMGGLIAGIFSLVLGLSVSRIRGDYLALVTLGFGVIVVDVARNWVELTGGPRGLPGIPYASIFGFIIADPLSYFGVVIIILLLSYFMLYRVVRSPFGRILEGIREDELAASSLGINTNLYKLKAFMLSSFLAGVAGSLYAHYLAFIDPNRFSIMVSFEIISMVIIGGVASLRGPLLGAILFVSLPELLRILELTSVQVGALRQIIFSMLILLVVIYRPKGILGRSVLLKRQD
jgi:branched-chain amino acid transport system permease protein